VFEAFEDLLSRCHCEVWTVVIFKTKLCCISFCLQLQRHMVLVICSALGQQQALKTLHKQRKDQWNGCSFTFIRFVSVLCIQPKRWNQARNQGVETGQLPPRQFHKHV